MSESPFERGALALGVDDAFVKAALRDAEEQGISPEAALLEAGARSVGVFAAAQAGVNDDCSEKRFSKQSLQNADVRVSISFTNEKTHDLHALFSKFKFGTSTQSRY